MKWKCDACVWGPCVYESTKDDDYLMRTDICPRGGLITRWKKMSDEEPERKRDGLPEWLRAGNFVKFGGCNPVCRIDGYDTEQKILSISRKVWREGRTVKVDVHCEAGWGEAQVFFPKPYTFETAPEIIKVRNKNPIVMDVLMAVFDAEGAGYTSVRNPDHPFISFSDVLRCYEHLDGWPCGTFDGEEG